MNILHDNHFTKFLPITVLAIALLSISASAQYGEFQIGDEPVDPRASAMGSAGTALAGKGFCAYNPASPAFAPAPFLSAEFGQIPGGMSRSLIESAWMFPRWFAGASMRVHSTDFGVTSEQTAGPDGVPLSSDQSLHAALDGGFTFGNGRFAGGHSVNFFQERIGERVYRAWTWSLGIVYRLAPRGITLGASMLNYVRLDTVVDPWYKIPRGWYEGAWGLPRYVRAGASWNDTIQSATMPFTVACDLVYSDVYDRVMVPLGAEAWITPFLAARAGSRINHPTDKFHVGAGVRWSNVAFDFDYGITQPAGGADIEPKWLFGLTYCLKSTSPDMLPAPKPGKRAQSAPPEPEKFAPPKTILLTPKAPDSMKTPPAVQDTITPVPDSTNTIPPDTSATGGSVLPPENNPVQDQAPGIPAVPAGVEPDRSANPEPSGNRQ